MAVVMQLAAVARVAAVAATFGGVRGGKNRREEAIEDQAGGGRGGFGSRSGCRNGDLGAPKGVAEAQCRLPTARVDQWTRWSAESIHKTNGF